MISAKQAAEILNDLTILGCQGPWRIVWQEEDTGNGYISSQVMYASNNDWIVRGRGIRDSDLIPSLRVLPEALETIVDLQLQLADAQARLATIASNLARRQRTNKIPVPVAGTTLTVLRDMTLAEQSILQDMHACLQASTSPPEGQ